MDAFSSFWPWYVTGPLIGLYVPALYLLLNRHFGVSSTFRDICAACLRPNVPYFQYNWKAHRWRLVFVAGIAIGAFLSTGYARHPCDRTDLAAHAGCSVPDLGSGIFRRSSRPTCFPGIR